MGKKQRPQLREDECDDVDRRPRPRSDGDEGPSKVVDRTWYYERDDDCDEGPHRHPRHEDDCGDEGPAGRPTRPSGKTDGLLDGIGGLTKGGLHAPDKPGVWVGPRANLDLPYLFMRANPGDIGARPVVGALFWESSDIFILGGVMPALAPVLPPALGQIAEAGKPNTLYVHVWNFGKAAANEVVV